ncbi:MAG: glycosyltransferase [Elusimicrobiota bacterium]|jgi:CMP-N-acetylneuraminic acid synthetase
MLSTTRRPGSPLVTVYIPSHNYGRFIERAVESVLRQTMSRWELIIINDGSTDDTVERLKRFEGLFGVRILHQTKKGLNVSNNVALRLANAPYVMRLDADDYLDESALLVMSHILDTKKDVGLVYPDYYMVDEEGEVLQIVRRKKIGSEAKLLDLPAHGACTMIRKECLLELGGYSEQWTCQDGYDLWLRFLRTFKPYNVNVPLFYYRQHEGSLTKNERKILDTRADIKRRFVRRHRREKAPKVLAIIPVARRSPDLPDYAFASVAGKPLLWHALKSAAASRMLDRIVVTSNDDKALAYARRFSCRKVTPLPRPDRLASYDARMAQTVSFVLKELKRTEGYVPDAVMLLYISCPLRRPVHIDVAIDTMAIFDVDSVVSVTEELAFCYHHGADGLAPVRKFRDIQVEKKGIYKENGAVILFKTKALDPRNLIGGRIGHIQMLPEESVRIKTRFDLWLADQIASHWLPRAAG